MSPSDEETPLGSADAEVATVSPQDLADAAVLTREDLGGVGWEEEPVDVEAGVGGGDPDQRTDNPACNHGNIAQLKDAAAAVAASGWWFDNGTATETVGSFAFVYADSRAASAGFADHRLLAENCASWAAGGIEGQDYAFAHEQTIFDVQVGDEAFGVDRSVSAPAFPDVAAGHTYVITARSGRTVQVTAFTSSFPDAPGISMVTGHAIEAASRAEAD